MTSDVNSQIRVWQIENSQTKIELQNPDHHQVCLFESATEPVDMIARQSEFLPRCLISVSL